MYIKKLFFLLLIVLGFFLEGTLTTIPFVLLLLIAVTVLIRNTVIFIPAFFLGILLDTMTLRPIGQTSMYFIFVLFLVFLYERKFEIQSLQFVTIASFFAVLGYSLFMQYPFAVYLAFLSAVFSSILYLFIKRFTLVTIFSKNT